MEKLEPVNHTLQPKVTTRTRQKCVKLNLKKVPNRVDHTGSEGHISSSFAFPESHRKLPRKSSSTVLKKKKMGKFSENKKYKCPECNKVFSRKGRLDIHYRIHTGERPFTCPFPNCGKAFAEKGNLKTHERTHTGERPYACPYSGCESRFMTQGHLKDHMRKHTGDRPYKCSICKSSFMRSNTLNVHMRIHTGEKPYKCTFPGCNKAFTESGNLNTHRKIHERMMNNDKPKDGEEAKMQIFRKEELEEEKKPEEPNNFSAFNPVPPATWKQSQTTKASTEELYLPPFFQMQSEGGAKDCTPHSFAPQERVISSSSKLPLTELDLAITPMNVPVQAPSPFMLRPNIISPINYNSFMPYIPAIPTVFSQTNSPAPNLFSSRSPLSCLQHLNGYPDFETAFNDQFVRKKAGAGPLPPFSPNIGGDFPNLMGRFLGPQSPIPSSFNPSKK